MPSVARCGTRARSSNNLGRLYYSFNRGAIHYVVVNDVFWIGGGYIGFVSGEQLSWLASDLAHVERGTPVVVFAHIPFACTVSERTGGKFAPHEAQVTNRARVFELLEPFAARFITAHTHENEHVFRGRVHEHVLGTVCGVISRCGPWAMASSASILTGWTGLRRASCFIA